MQVGMYLRAAGFPVNKPLLMFLLRRYLDHLIVSKQISLGDTDFSNRCLPLFIWVYTSQAVHDFFHQQYLWILLGESGMMLPYDDVRRDWTSFCKYSIFATFVTIREQIEYPQDPTFAALTFAMLLGIQLPYFVLFRPIYFRMIYISSYSRMIYAIAKYSFGIKLIRCEGDWGDFSV